MAPFSQLYFLAWAFTLSAATFELCNPGKSDQVYRFTTEQCPSGVLFAYPVTAGCMASSYSPDFYLSDLCDEDSYIFDLDENPYRIQLAFGEGGPTELDPDASCASINTPDRCNTTTVIFADSASFQEPHRPDPCDTDFPDAVLNEDDISRRRDPKIFNQTERLFRYMSGLVPSFQKEPPKFRAIQILEQTFEILRIFSNPSFISGRFINDILKSFLFLLRDSDLSRFVDMPPEDFDLVWGELEKCKKYSKAPFKVVGHVCKNCSFAYAIEKNNQTLRYLENDLTFVWGRYDVVIDAVWSVLSFTHGLCYGTFRLPMHQLYHRAAELLFTADLQYRWTHPPELHFEDIWDHMLSAPVRNTMRNLDVFVVAAYSNPVPLHRWERPLKIHAAKERKERKKRGLSPMTLDQEGLHLAGWCFQTKQDLFATVAAYVNMHCPGIKRPVEHLINFFAEAEPSTEQPLEGEKTEDKNGSGIFLGGGEAGDDAGDGIGAKGDTGGGGGGPQGPGTGFSPGSKGNRTKGKQQTNPK